MKTRNMTANASSAATQTKLRPRSRRLKEAGKRSFNDDFIEANIKPKGSGKNTSEIELSTKDKREKDASPEIRNVSSSAKVSSSSSELQTHTSKKRKLNPRRTLIASAWTVSSSVENLFEETQSEASYLSDADKNHSSASNQQQPAAVVLGVSTGVKNNKKKLSKITASKSRKLGSSFTVASDWNRLVVVPPQCRNTSNDKDPKMKEEEEESMDTKETTDNDPYEQQDIICDDIFEKAEVKNDTTSEMDIHQAIEPLAPAKEEEKKEEERSDTELLAVAKNQTSDIIRGFSTVQEEHMEVDHTIPQNISQATLEVQQQQQQEEVYAYGKKMMEVPVLKVLEEENDTPCFVPKDNEGDDNDELENSNHVKMMDSIHQKIGSKEVNVEENVDHHSTLSREEGSDYEQKDIISGTTYQNISLETENHKTIPSSMEIDDEVLDTTTTTTTTTSTTTTTIITTSTATITATTTTDTSSQQIEIEKAVDTKEIPDEPMDYISTTDETTTGLDLESKSFICVDHGKLPALSDICIPGTVPDSETRELSRIIATPAKDTTALSEPDEKMDVVPEGEDEKFQEHEASKSLEEHSASEYDEAKHSHDSSIQNLEEISQTPTDKRNTRESESEAPRSDIDVAPLQITAEPIVPPEVHEAAPPKRSFWQRLLFFL
ncbi:hypothetical protein J3Q64DRAFT_1736100 [Phycomyces blakesleeanus]|uniref:Uncharacterized protein n=1 Tax=Phycomyces blakesleeanus TaxID=4837 RepID=A0ABR3B175_PHYBL